MLLERETPDPLHDERHRWPESARDMLEVLEQSGVTDDERRRALRARCYAVGRLVLLNPDYEGVEWPLYLRDLTSQAAGFITSLRPPDGEPGVLHFRAGSQLLEIDCDVTRRCEPAPGWYEGVLHFHRQQSHLTSGRTP